MTVNLIPTSDFWIINANPVTYTITHPCITCRSLLGRIGKQKMSELSFDRLQEELLFTYYGVDLFGPFLTKVS